MSSGGRDRRHGTVSRGLVTSNRTGGPMKKLVPLAVVAAALAAWIAVSPATSAPGAAAGSKLQLRKGKLGRFVVDGRSMTLYLFEKDTHGKSACYSSCAKVWSPLIVSRRPSAGAGVVASKIGTTKRKGGKLQATY